MKDYIVLAMFLLMYNEVTFRASLKDPFWSLWCFSHMLIADDVVGYVSELPAIYILDIGIFYPYVQIVDE